MINKTIMLTSPDGETLHLHMPPTKVVTEITGFGLSPRELASVRFPFRDGSRVLSTRLDDREIRMLLTYPGCSWDRYLANRNTIIDFLRESRTSLIDPKPYTLSVDYVKNGVIYNRDIKVYLSEGGTLDQNAQTQWSQWSIVRDELVFRAPNPIWYDPTVVTETMAEDTTPAFTWPTAFGVTRYVSSITYGGDWQAFPTIVITGNTFGFGIYNFSNGKTIKFSGQTQLDNPVTITLGETSVTCEDSYCHSLGNYLSGDIGDFVISPDPQVSGGVNSIYAYVEGDATIQIKYNDQWRGILR